MLLDFITWNVDPVCFSLGKLSVRWYGVLWALGLWLALMIMTKIYKREKLADGLVDKLFLYAVVGVIIGARLGHCYFYEWHQLAEPIQFLGMTFNYGNEYVVKPWRLIAIWEGGLSSHGGAIGILIAIWFYAKKYFGGRYLWVLDRLIISIAVCGACIRLGNLMNSEIFGFPTDLPWGFKFVRSYEWQMLYSADGGQACHPTQIYEMLYCLVVFAICLTLYLKTNIGRRDGLLLGIFWLGIFGTRFILEFIKNDQEEFESHFFLNMGQVLSIPLILWGIYLVIMAFVKGEKEPPVVKFNSKPKTSQKSK